MRRIIVALTASAIASFALTVSAQAAGAGSSGGGAARAHPGAKAPKPQRYEWCGSVSGCGFVFDFYPKTKTWVEESTGERGTFTTGPKGTLSMRWETGCRARLKRVSKTKNYTGEEAGGPEYCFTQTVRLTRL